MLSWRGWYLLALLASFIGWADAQTLVSTYAGSGIASFSNGAAANSGFDEPSGVAVDASGNVYVADFRNDALRLVSPSGAVTSLASWFWSPPGVAVSPSGDVYVADQSSHLIKKIASGSVTVVAGSTGGYADGVSNNAKFFWPRGLAADSAFLFVGDYFNHCIRAIALSSNTVTTLAGATSGGGYSSPGYFADGVGTVARFNRPYGVALGHGNSILYVADSYNNRVRSITISSRTVSTVAGGSSGFADGRGAGASFNGPSGVAYSAGILYVTDINNHCVRAIVVSTQEVSTIAGSGVAGFADGLNSLAKFNLPIGIAIDQSGQQLFVADSINHRIRLLSLNLPSQTSSVTTPPTPSGTITLSPAVTPTPSATLTPSSCPVGSVCPLKCAAGDVPIPVVTAIPFSMSHDLVHAFSATTGMLYIAHTLGLTLTLTNTPLFSVSTNSNSSLFNVTSSVNITTARWGLRHMCVSANGDAVALAFDNEGGAANYMAFSGGSKLNLLASSLGGGAGVVGMACDTVSTPLKSYLQFWGGSQPIEVFNQAGGRTGAATPSVTSWSKAYYIHTPHNGSSLFVIAALTTALFRVNVATMLIDLNPVPFNSTWQGARLVWNSKVSQLVMGASTSSCSVVIGFSPSSLAALGPAACVAPTGSLASSLPAIDSEGHLFFVTLSGSLLQFTFSPSFGALALASSPFFPLSNVSIGSAIPVNVNLGIYFPSAAKQSTPGAPVVVVTKLDANNAVAVRVDLVCGSAAASRTSAIATTTTLVSTTPSSTQSNSLTASPTSSSTAWPSPTSSHVGRASSMFTLPLPNATFDYTGAYQTFAVPAGVTMVEVHIWGGGGGGYSHDGPNRAFGGSGAFIRGTLAVASSETLRVIVGCGACATGSDASGGAGVSDWDFTQYSYYGSNGGGGRSAIQRCTLPSGCDTTATTLPPSPWSEIVTAGGGGATSNVVGGFASWSGSGARPIDCAKSTEPISCSGGAGSLTAGGGIGPCCGHGGSLFRGGTDKVGGGGGVYGGAGGGNLIR